MDTHRPSDTRPVPMAHRLQILATFSVALAPGTTLSWFLISNPDATMAVTTAAALILAFIHQNTGSLLACDSCGFFLRRRDRCRKCSPHPTTR